MQIILKFAGNKIRHQVKFMKITIIDLGRESCKTMQLQTVIDVEGRISTIFLYDGFSETTGIYLFCNLCGMEDES